MHACFIIGYEIFSCVFQGIANWESPFPGWYVCQFIVQSLLYCKRFFFFRNFGKNADNCKIKDNCCILYPVCVCVCTFFNFFLTLCVYNSLFSPSDIICSKIAAEQRERPNCILFMSFDFTDCYLHLQKCLLSGADYELRIWLCMLLQVYILILVVLSWPVMWITDVTCISAKWELVWYMQLKMTWEKRPVRHWSVSFMHML